MTGILPLKNMAEKSFRPCLTHADECHHCGSNTSVEVMQKVNARYVHGVSATLKRGDHQDKIIHMFLGPVRYSYTAKERAVHQGIGHYVYPRYTRVIDSRENKDDINGAYSLISNHTARNDMILEDTRVCVKAGRTPVILTRRKDQAKYLYDHLQKDADHVFILYGDNSDKENLNVRKSLKEVPGDQSLILVATGQKIGEGEALFISCKIKTGSRSDRDSHNDESAKYSSRKSGVLSGIDRTNAGEWYAYNCKR